MRWAGRLRSRLADRYIDQSTLAHLAGARGYHNNIEWVVPTDAAPDFPAIMVNPVLAPTKSRHFIADGTNGVKVFNQNGGEIDLATTNLFKMATVDGIRTMMDPISPPPPRVRSWTRTGCWASAGSNW